VVVGGLVVVVAVAVDGGIVVAVAVAWWGIVVAIAVAWWCVVVVHRDWYWWGQGHDVGHEEMALSWCFNRGPMGMSDKIIALLVRIQTYPIQRVAEWGARGRSNQKRGRNAPERNGYMRVKNSGVFTVVLH
jgi:hypothetical protein